MKTTIDREVIQQALEALNHGITEMNNRGCAIECMPLHHAAKAMREALAQTQPVQQEPKETDWNAVHEKLIDVWNRELSADEGLDEIQDLIYTSPQAAQPQTVQHREIRQFRKQHCSDWYDGVADHEDGRGPYEERTLYTSLQAAQPLSDQQILNLDPCPHIMFDAQRIEFARAIEAAITKGAA